MEQGLGYIMSKRIQVKKSPDRYQSIQGSISDSSVRGLLVVLRGVAWLFIVVALPFSAFVLMVVALFNSIYGVFAESFVWSAGVMMLLYFLLRPFVSHRFEKNGRKINEL